MRIVLACTHRYQVVTDQRARGWVQWGEPNDQSSDYNWNAGNWKQLALSVGGARHVLTMVLESRKCRERNVNKYILMVSISTIGSSSPSHKSQLHRESTTPSSSTSRNRIQR